MAAHRAQLILARAARLTGRPTDHMEMPTVARYLHGQRYVQHHDAFPPGDPMADRERYGGNRVCTVLVYLNDVGHGGRTLFHRAVAPVREGGTAGSGGGGGGIAITPRAGAAVVFFPADCVTGDYDPLALHEAEPAVDEKWVAQLWVRQGAPGGMRTMAGRTAAADAAVEAEAMQGGDSGAAAAALQHVRLPSQEIRGMRVG
jgi:hypothetical protein